jgi:3-phytase
MHIFIVVMTMACLGVLVYLNGTPSQYRSDVISPKVSTSAVNDDADDCAIWIHPRDPSQSIIIGTDKGKRGGGLFVWNLKGEQLQYIQLDEPNNVDVRQGMMVGRNLIDIAVVNEQRSREIKVYQIDPASSKLVDITTIDGIKTPELDEPYGLCLYRRPSDGAMFVIQSTKTGDKGNLHQYRLQDDGNGKVKGIYVRAFGNNTIRNKVEGLVADDELGYVYASDESKAVRKYYANPDWEDHGQIVAFAKGDGIDEDREGLGLYKCADGTGYLLVSSQGSSTVKVYRREGEPDDPHKHVLIATIDTRGSSETDGLEVTSLAAGPIFPNGFLAKHNSKGRNFALYAWEDIAQSGLKICTQNKGEYAPSDSR